jgi:hypothetical protein
MWTLTFINNVGEKCMRATQHSVFVAFIIFSIYCLSVTVESAQAKIYKWKDDKGTTHFTDNENNIPPKFRKKEKLEKLKGLTKPKPTKEQIEETSEKENDDEAIDQEADAEVVDENVSNETILFLEEVKAFLEKKIRRHKKILKSVPVNVENGKYIILPLKYGAKKKYAMADKIKASGIKSLKPVSTYLITSGSLDEDNTMGGDDYLSRIIESRTRMESEILVKENLVKIVDQEIAIAQEED